MSVRFMYVIKNYIPVRFHQSRFFLPLERKIYTRFRKCNIESSK